MAHHEAAILDPNNSASPLSITAERTALLLMDYHNTFIGLGGEAAFAAVKQGKSMRDWASANGVLVVHCLVDMKQPILSSFKGAHRFKQLAARMNMQEQPDAANEHKDIAFDSTKGEFMFTRPPGYISVLKSPDLGPLLRSKGIKSVLLCGVSTSGCVLSTARGAGDDEYIVTVIEDACMDRVPGLHETLIQKVLPSQAHVTTAVEFQEQWHNVDRN
ncbi:unnamed protein product [Calypogeia fissa]